MSREEIRTVGFQLADWQKLACDRWEVGAHGQPYRGTLEIFTGGGKTLIALEALSRVSRKEGFVTAGVVVPTQALARQWVDSIVRHTSLCAKEVGLLGAGSKSNFDKCKVIVSVINTAAKLLPSLVRDPARTMLIVDECHRAGASTFSRVLSTPARFRLGLSATPDREEINESGEPLDYGLQLVGQSLGDVVYRFTLRDAREAGWLPDFDIHHHGTCLTPPERLDYERASRRIDDLSDRLGDLGVDTVRVRALAAGKGEVATVAAAYVAATAKRKDILYRASERGRVAVRIVQDELRRSDTARVLMFHERVEQAEKLFRQLRDALGDASVALEHSGLSASGRTAALRGFRDGRTQALVSVKSLIEGIDVPEADVGVSVAASSSVRQRVQSLGRVLRRRFDESRPRKHASMHLLYVADSVDEVIYGKENWADLTGDGPNYYWSWSLEVDIPKRKERPPREPKPTEEEEWERLGRMAPAFPMKWCGEIPNRELSVDTRGNVRTASGELVVNGQGVDAMVESVRGRPGGRFYVTPTHRLVLVRSGAHDGEVFVVGRAPEPFTLQKESGRGEVVEVNRLQPGDVYAGTLDKANGTFKLGQRRGGVLERRLKGGVVEYALTAEPGDPVRTGNGNKILENWRSLSMSGMTFHVNGAWHAWYSDSGEARFLGNVPNGFNWPSDDD